MTPILKNIQIDDSGLALNPVTGETFRLSSSALQLVRMLQQKADTDALLRHLLEEYNVDESTARRDLETFLSQLKQLNWVDVES